MCEVITLPNGSTAFICNCKKQDHECDENDSCLILACGNRVKDTPENQIKYMSEIRGGSVACSVCGRALIDNYYWG
jgi:hypothetical protein